MYVLYILPIKCTEQHSKLEPKGKLDAWLLACCIVQKRQSADFEIAHLEAKRWHGLKETGKRAKEIDGAHGGAIALLVKQPSNDGYAQKPKSRYDVCHGCEGVIGVPFVL